jgi:hypothetical protein
VNAALARIGARMAKEARRPGSFTLDTLRAKIASMTEKCA